MMAWRRKPKAYLQGETGLKWQIATGNSYRSKKTERSEDARAV
jgi:hypothetical protein